MIRRIVQRAAVVLTTLVFIFTVGNDTAGSEEDGRTVITQKEDTEKWAEEIFKPIRPVEAAKESKELPKQNDIPDMVAAEETEEGEMMPTEETVLVAELEQETEQEPQEEPAEKGEPELEYLGCWCITAYCPCEICCGSRSGMTSSGEPAVSGHTAASNILPYYTRVMIDGVIYTIEDTGYTEYGDEWIDIYFDTHEEALNYGVQWHDVYIMK